MRLSYGQQYILKRIADGKRPAEIAAELSVSKQRVSQIVARLVELGLVAKSGARYPTIQIEFVVTREGRRVVGR